MPQGGNQGNRGDEYQTGSTEEAGEKEVAGADTGCAGETGNGTHGQGGGPVMTVVNLSPKGLVPTQAAAAALSKKARLGFSVWGDCCQARPTASFQASGWCWASSRLHLPPLLRPG